MTASTSASLTSRSTVRSIRATRELFVNLVQRELRAKFKTTALGWLWSLMNPIAQVLIFTIVVKFIFRVKLSPGAHGVDFFPAWVLCGVIVWNFFTIAATMGLNSLTDNANLVQKAAFPRAQLILSAAVAQAVTSGIEVAVLVVLLLCLGVVPFLWLPLVFVIYGALLAFTVGLAFLLSIANVYFRDTSHLMGIVFQVWFYATPIIYPFEQLTTLKNEGKLAPWLLDLYQLNPMVDTVTCVRDALYYQRFPSPFMLGYAVAASLATLVVGWLVFKRFEPRLAEEI